MAIQNALPSGKGVLAVPVMTTGAAYAVSQVMGWKHSLHHKPREAKKFYAAIGVFTALAMERTNVK